MAWRVDVFAVLLAAYRSCVEEWLRGSEMNLARVCFFLDGIFECLIASRCDFFEVAGGFVFIFRRQQWGRGAF